MDLCFIAEKVISQLHDRDFISGLTWKNYHGFLKSRLPDVKFRLLAHELGFDAEKCQAEIVEVTKDLSKEIHLHRNSRAYCVVLGEKDGFADPLYASVFLGDEWKPVRVGDIVDIPPSTTHGFTIDKGGRLFFLSLQTPPIEHEGGDDYERIHGS